MPVAYERITALRRARNTSRRDGAYEKLIHRQLRRLEIGDGMMEHAEKDAHAHVSRTFTALV
jgi:hypothetical protein